MLNQLLEFKGLGDSGPALAQVLLAEDEAPAFLLFLETSKLHFSGPLTGQPLPPKKPYEKPKTQKEVQLVLCT